MHLIKNPRWIEPELLHDRTLDEIPAASFDKINVALARIQSDRPLVSITIPAYNEEASIIRTLYSLSQSRTKFPVEIIVVNNNSTDRTQEVLDRLHVRSVFQPKPGWGPARQKGLEAARGRYILSADADCIYPPQWIQRLTEAVARPGVTCVYGGYSFLAPPGESRLKYFVYESLKSVVVVMRDLRRPWFNCGGASMAYPRELALQIGFVDRKIRGEDGRMCYELGRLGKIKRVRGATVWTSPRTLQQEGNLAHSLMARARFELARIAQYFRPQPDHDTHTSDNSRPLPGAARNRSVHSHK